MTAPIELDPRGADPQEIYHLLTAIVVPRPIAWISTLSADGTPNLAPHSFFMVAANYPPHVAFSSTKVRDTLTNIRATEEFVVNVVGREQLVAMNATSAEVGPDVDEFALAAIPTAPSVVIAPPRVAAARAHLECRVAHEVPVGDSHLVIAEVVHIHVDAAALRGDRVDAGRLDPIARLGGADYTSLGVVLRLARPRRDSEFTREDG